VPAGWRNGAERVHFRFRDNDLISIHAEIPHIGTLLTSERNHYYGERHGWSR
jgi:hypothetical protein